MILGPLVFSILFGSVHMKTKTDKQELTGLKVPVAKSPISDLTKSFDLPNEAIFRFKIPLYLPYIPINLVK